VPFFVNRLQDRANRSYLRAIERAVGGGPGASV
jgi:hypothetical protein